MITRLARRPATPDSDRDGVGPAAGANEPSLQVIYRLGTTAARLAHLGQHPAGRDRHAHRPDPHPDRPRAAGDRRIPVAVDGAPLAVHPAVLSVRPSSGSLRPSRPSPTPPRPATWLSGARLPAARRLVVAALRRRRAVPLLILHLGTVLSASMMLTGSVPWQADPRPGLVLGSDRGRSGRPSLTWRRSSSGVGSRSRRPIAAAALTVAGFTVTPALGGPDADRAPCSTRGRSTGCAGTASATSTFAAYASAGLLLARLRRLRSCCRPRVAAVVAVAVIGFGIVICEGWPTMGTDFGGVIALTPPVLWLLLVLAVCA